jgi:hypothetical protein
VEKNESPSSLTEFTGSKIISMIGDFVESVVWIHGLKPRIVAKRFTPDKTTNSKTSSPNLQVNPK